MPPKLIEKIIPRKKRCDKKARANYCGISPTAYTNSRNSAECFWEIGISSLVHTSAQTSARTACSFFISVSMYAQAHVVCIALLKSILLWYFAYRLIPVQETRQSFSAVLYTISTVLTSQRLRLYIKMRVPLHSHSFLVGVTGLEPMAS